MQIRMTRECDGGAVFDVKTALACQYVREGIAAFVRQEDAERMGFSVPVRSELPETAVKRVTRERAVRR